MPVKSIVAGAEVGLPRDAPSLRIDGSGDFSFVGSLSVQNQSGSFIGSGVALSREWILTAGHNADLNDDGQADNLWSASFHVPGYGEFMVDYAVLHPDFTGFANPSVNDDIALLRLAIPLPDFLPLPTWGAAVDPGDTVALVGFGRSGYGDYGYTTSASLTNRRSGLNVIDAVYGDDEGKRDAELFQYDFDNPETVGLPGGSLGNHLETIIGPGDSGGALLVKLGEKWNVAGINTFTEGYGGRFGDSGGGILIAPYHEWILKTTSLPEPSVAALVLIVVVVRLTGRGLRKGNGNG